MKYAIQYYCKGECYIYTSCNFFADKWKALNYFICYNEHAQSYIKIVGIFKIKINKTKEQLLIEKEERISILQRTEAIKRFNILPNEERDKI